MQYVAFMLLFAGALAVGTVALLLRYLRVRMMFRLPLAAVYGYLAFDGGVRLAMAILRAAGVE